MADEEKVEILGAKMVGGLFCHYKFQKALGKDTYDSGTIKSGRPMHDDLKACFSALTIHMPLIMQDLKPGDVEDINSFVSGQETTDDAAVLIEKFSVHEIVVDLEKQAASIIGTKSLDLGILHIATPFIRSEGDYHFALEFRVAVDKLRQEVVEYINGKQAPAYEQGDLFPDGEDDLQEKEEIPEVKRGRGRPKGSGKIKTEKKVKTVVGIFVDDNWPTYSGRDIIDQIDAEDGDIIGIDANDGSPIIFEKPESEPLSNFQIDPSKVKDEVEL